MKNAEGYKFTAKHHQHHHSGAKDKKHGSGKKPAEAPKEASHPQYKPKDPPKEQPQKEQKDYPFAHLAANPANQKVYRVKATSHH